MKIGNIKTYALALTIAATTLPAIGNKCYTPECDSFRRVISPKGTDSLNELKNAPNPDVVIKGEKKKAKIIVDLSRNILYKYNNEGKPEASYLVGSGKKSTPTGKGVRIVSHVETYPYRTAPPHTKRRRNPRAYGPKIIILNKLNKETGEQSQSGVFIHGNNDSSSIGKYVSKGCIRMDNEIIKKLASEVKRGDIVIFQ